jgi:hypothetical protein
MSWFGGNSDKEKVTVGVGPNNMQEKRERGKKFIGLAYRTVLAT